MRIKKISVRNFKSCPDFDGLELGKVNAFVGKNGAGKSSLQRAIAFLLTGDLPVAPIRVGETWTSVSAVIDDGTDAVVERRAYLPDAWAVDGRPASMADARDLVASEASVGAVPTIVGGSPEFGSADAASISAFIVDGTFRGKRTSEGCLELAVSFPDGRSAYRRKGEPTKCLINGKKTTAKAIEALLSGAGSMDARCLRAVTSSDLMDAMPTKDFAKFLTSVVPVTADFEKLADAAGLGDEAKAWLRGRFPAAPAPVTQDDVAKAFRGLVAERTAAGREENAMRKRAAFHGEAPTRPATEIAAELDAANRKVWENGKAKEEASRIMAARSARERTLATAVAWKAQLASMGDPERFDPSARSSMLAGEEALRAAIASDSRAAAAFRAANAPLMALLSNLDSEACPICPAMRCTTDKRAVKADVEAAARYNEDGARAADARVAENSARLSELEGRRRAMEDDDRRRSAKDDLERRLAALEASAGPEIPEPAPVPDGSALMAEAERLGRELEAARAAEFSSGCLAAAEEAGRRKAVAAWLAKICDPKGGALSNAVLSMAVGPFASHANAFLAEIDPGAEIAFSMEDDGLNVMAKAPGGPFLPVAALSAGERATICLALMDVLSSASNARTLEFDRMEELDAEIFSRALDAFTIGGAASRYDTVTFATVSHRAAMEELEKRKGSVNVVDVDSYRSPETATD